MKTSIILALILVSTCVLADQSKFQANLQNLLNMQARATDAVDSALQLLQDLKNANVESQNRANEINKTQEETLGRQIAQLLAIADQNKAIGDESTAHRKKLQQEIENTQTYLVWNVKRRQTIQEKRVTLREQRCYGNMMFIKALKEHDEALQVVRWLREDIIGVIAERQGGEFIDLSKIQDSKERLKAYAHLFDQKALEEFNQLTQNEAQGVNQEYLEWDENANDNDRQGLEVDRMTSGTSERDVGAKVLQAIDRLEEHLETSIKDLEANEIEAAWSLAVWLQDTDAEFAELEKEFNVQQIYMDKLLIAIIGAKAREDEVWEIYFESAATYNEGVHDRELKRQWYAQETARRNEENALLDECVKIFLERVGVLDAGMRAKVDDFSVDGVFNENTDIARRTDANLARDLGQLGANTDSEARS